MIPNTLTVDSIPVPIAGSGWTPPLSVDGCPGWTRETFTTDAAVVVRWYDRFVARLGGPAEPVVLLDVMNRQRDRLLTVDADGKIELVWPLAGLGFSSGHPGEATDKEGQGDSIWKKALAQPFVDRMLYHEAGSPRAGAYDPIATLAKRDGFLSKTKQEMLGRFVEEQLRRPYQDPEANGIPVGLYGSARLPTGTFPGVTHWEGPCLCHLAVLKLVTAYELTGSPRALDQLVRLIFHAAGTNYYLKPGKLLQTAPRMGGWWLFALAKTMRVLKQVPSLASALGPRVYTMAAKVVKELNDAWAPGVWSPWETTNGAGGHTTEPHDIGFMQSVLGLGALTCANQGVVGARRLWSKVVDWLDAYAWDRSNPHEVVVYYDVLRAGGGTLPRPAGDGVRFWMISILQGSDTELEARFAARAIDTRWWGLEEIDTRLGLFPVLNWRPEGFAQVTP